MTDKSTFVQSIYQAALAAGLTDAAARVMASQGALESEYGNKAPGNNFFGVKAGKSWDGPTQLLTTHEVIDGKSVKVKDKFRVYDSPEAAIADRVKFMESRFPGFNAAQTVGDALDALQNGVYGKYYTAKKEDYEGAVNSINQRYLGGSPTPPGGIAVGGAGGNAVNAVQQQLKAAGFDPGPVDGVKGPKTEAAIKAFQKANGLTADGIVGPKTLAALSAAAPRSAALSDTATRNGVGSGPSSAELGNMLAPPAPPQAITVHGGDVSPLLRLPSGKMIAPGVYPAGDGQHQLQVTAGPNGTAQVNKLLNPGEIPGVIDPLHEGKDTVAGSIIQRMLREAQPQAAGAAGAISGDAAAAAANLGNSIKESTVAPLANTGNALMGIGGALGSSLGALFGGGAPRAVPPIQASGTAAAGTDVPAGVPPSHLFDWGNWVNPVPQLTGTTGTIDASGAAGAGTGPRKGDLILAPSAKSLDSWGWGSLASEAAQRAYSQMFGNDNALAPSINVPHAAAPAGMGIGAGVSGAGVQMAISPEWTAWKAAQDAARAAGGGMGQFAGVGAGVVPAVAPEPPKYITVRGGQTSAPAPAAAPPPPPVVQLASGSRAQVGTTGTAQGGAYQYQVQPDGSVVNLTTGRTTAPAPQATPSQAAQRAADMASVTQAKGFPGSGRY